MNRSSRLKNSDITVQELDRLVGAGFLRVHETLGGSCRWVQSSGSSSGQFGVRRGVILSSIPRSLVSRLAPTCFNAITLPSVLDLVFDGLHLASATRTGHEDKEFLVLDVQGELLTLCIRPAERQFFVGRSEGFPIARKTKSSCACDCERGPVSVGAFFFVLLSFFFFLVSCFVFFAHPESCLKIQIFVRQSDVVGGKGRKKAKSEKLKNEKCKTEKKFKKNSKNEKIQKKKKKKRKIQKMRKCKNEKKTEKRELTPIRNCGCYGKLPGGYQVFDRLARGSRRAPSLLCQAPVHSCQDVASEQASCWCGVPFHLKLSCVKGQVGRRIT